MKLRDLIQELSEVKTWEKPRVELEQCRSTGSWFLRNCDSSEVVELPRLEDEEDFYELAQADDGKYFVGSDGGKHWTPFAVVACHVSCDL